MRCIGSLKNNVRIKQSNQEKRLTHSRHILSNDDSSVESDDDTYNSEMGWSFSSIWDAYSNNDTDNKCEKSISSFSSEIKKELKVSKEEGISPFVSNTNRKMDVLEKFGTIVNSLRKPGHHVGPSKNADCLCYNCRIFFSKK